MLSQFKIKNFRSIRELTVDFSYGEGKAPNGYQQSETLFFHEKNKKERIVPCLAFYGANATGKTNIIRAMEACITVAIHGVSGGRFAPNLLNPPSDTTAFILDFFVGQNKFTYQLEYNAHTIVTEILRCNGKALYSITDAKIDFSPIAAKDYPNDRLQNIYRVEGGAEYRKRTFLSVICRGYEGLNKQLISAYRFITEGMFILPANNIPPTQGVDFLARIYAQQETVSNHIQQAFNTIIGELKKLDIDIANIALKRNKVVLDSPEGRIGTVPNAGSTKVSFVDGKVVIDTDEITTWHKDIHGNLVSFNFFTAESAGTKILVGLLGILLKALHDGNVVMIDELDRSLHPFLLHTIVRMFKNKRRNANGAQLIFTAHDLYMLEDQKLRVSEIGIVKKTLKNGTTVTRLCEDKTLRNVSNFKQLYLDGVYGGIPFPHL